MTNPHHEWDPRIVFANVDEARRLYYGTDTDEDLFCLVDKEDWLFLMQWSWSLKASRGGKKFYLRRVSQELHQPQFFCDHERKLIRIRTQKTVFLHRAVLERANIIPPSDRHSMVDHIDGNAMNNCKSNLRWATPAENRKNRKNRK